MNGVRRFTAERRDCNGASIIGDIHNCWTIWFKTAELRDAFVAQVNDTRTDDLPPGVHRIDGRLWLLPEHPLPDGWEWATAMNKTPQWSSDRDSFVNLKRVRMFEVRPVQQPDTERVPWWEALRDARKVAFPNPRSGDESGKTYAVAWSAVNVEGAVVLRCNGKDAYPTAADGTVEVLKDGGRS